MGVAESCAESVVKMEASTSTGTESIWDTEGLVVTNNHVAVCDNGLKVTLSDGSCYKADVVARYRSQDLALLRIRSIDQSKLKPIVPSSQALHIRQSVFTIGYPLHCDKTVTNGFISSFPRDPICTDIPEVRIRDVIQLDANINLGDSGGPLYDSNGYFIGVIVSSILHSGIAYAIPLSTVTNMVGKFIRRDRASQQLAVGLLLPPPVPAYSAQPEIPCSCSICRPQTSSLPCSCNMCNYNASFGQ